jgi:hypothetical protein
MDRLVEELEILSSSATDGFAVSYIHTAPAVDSLGGRRKSASGPWTHSGHL